MLFKWGLTVLSMVFFLVSWLACQPPDSSAAGTSPSNTVISTNHLLEQKKMASIYIFKIEFERFYEITVRFDELLLAAACT